MQPGDLVGGRFRIIELLGRGGSSDVYAVTDDRAGEARALKLVNALDARTTATLTRRVRREARAMQSIEHPNVLRVHEVGEMDGRAYLVMDRAAGSVQKRLLSGGLSAAATVGWMLQVLSALDTAHGLGVVHRDVKPQNILLDAGDRALLADFGIALVVDTTRFTRTGASIGSSAYMPPEQRLDVATVDARADIYSCGATLFRLLTGGNPVDLFLDGPESPRVSGLPPGLRDVVLVATRLDPGVRYRDARRMAAALMNTFDEAKALDADRAERWQGAQPRRFDLHTEMALEWLGDESMEPMRPSLSASTEITQVLGRVPTDPDSA